MLTRVLTVAAVALLAVAAILGAMRVVHDRELAREWERLATPAATHSFDPRSLAALPAPARRYLERAIAPGTALAASVTLHMEGRIGLRPGADKLPFRAEQLLAAPHGLIWKAAVGERLLRFSGDDRYVGGEGGMRWYLWHVVPVVSANGPDVSRSAAGRVALEAAALLPAALLPESGAQWQPVDDRSARVELTVGGERCSILLSVDEDGRLQRIEMQRWDGEGPDGRPGYVLWAVDGLEETFSAGGYTIPRRVRVTRRAGTPQADAFFEATITAATFR